MEGRFATRLVELLTSHSCTAYRLAKDLGISETHVGRLACGEQLPSPDLAGQIARRFGVSAEELQACADIDRLGPVRARAVAGLAIALESATDRPGRGGEGTTGRSA